MKEGLKMGVCAITGHRPSRFQFRHNEHDPLCQKIKNTMTTQFVHLYQHGIYQFWIGGAQGVDMWAGELLLQMQAHKEYNSLEINLAIPFVGYDSEWSEAEHQRLSQIRKGCSQIVVVGDSANAKSYQQRNYYMVYHADFVLAVYDHNRAIRSGTRQTVNYARKKNIPIILIHPDTAEVTLESVL
jgi:uncharacterized phage-like protein YoqJ